MRVIQPDQFKKMAREAVDAYLQQKVPMTKSLAKTADTNALNPDQIRNLVQLANTMAHLTLFDQKNDGDKIVEFDPADPDTVIKQVFVDGEPEHDSETCPECSGSSGSVDNTSDMFGDLSGVLDKVKEVLKGDGTTSSTESTPEKVEETETPAGESPSENTPSPAKRQMLIIKIRKVASELENKQAQAAFEYKEELDKLASDFAKLYGPDFTEFEKDAVALRGELSAPILADLRSCLKMPLTSLEELNAFTKTARVVDSATKPIRSLDKLIKLNTAWEEYGQARQYLAENIGGQL